MNQNGGVDGLHKLGTSKKSSGTSYDCPLRKKFCASRKLFSSMRKLKTYPRPGQMMMISVPARVSSTLAIA
ncbi:hypothetical protein DBY73_016930 [Enterobacter sp. RIT418]|nr:hypothetical protein DBY73_016930 [Enterobacter sp. RIT 418]